MKTKIQKFDKDFWWLKDFLEKNRSEIFVSINRSDYTGCDNFWVRLLDLGKKMEKIIKIRNENLKKYGM